jgi:drug/metabolite transporter (DMT)-like permease
MIATSLVFAMQDGISRHLAGTYNVWMVVMIRYWFFAAFVVAMAARVPGGLAAAVATRQPWVQAARGLLLALEVCVMVTGFVLLGLVESHAVFAAYPLLVAALSGPVLGEKVGWRRWTAVAVGFLGVLIILRPGSGLLGAPGLAMLGASFFAATTIALLRKAPLDPPLVSAFWTNLGVAGGGLALLPFAHVTPSGPELATVVTAGLLAAAAFSLQAVSLRAARAAVVAPFQYVQILFGLAVGALLFGDPPPDRVTALGALIVIGSGLYVLHRETRRRGAGG